MSIYLKIVDNPLKREDAKVVEVPFVYCKKLREILEENGLDSKTVVYGGKEVDLDTHHIVDRSVFIVLPKIGWEALVAIGAFYVTYIQPVVTIAAFAYAVYSYVANRPSNEDNVPSTPTYGWDGIHTQEQIGIPVPVIYGEHRFGGNRINHFVSGVKNPELLNPEEQFIWQGHTIKMPNPNWNPKYSFDSNRFWNLDGVGGISKTSLVKSNYVNTFTTPECFGIQFSVVQKKMHLEYDGGSDVRTAQQLLTNCRGVANIGGDEYARFIIHYKASGDSAFTRLYESVEKGLVVVQGLPKATYDLRVELDARNCTGFDSSDFYISDLKYYVDEGTPPSVTDQDQYYNCLIALCEGDVDAITQPWLAGESLGNKMTGDRNLLFNTRLGTTGQLPVPGFNEGHNLGGFKGDAFNSLNDSRVYTTDGEVDAYEVHLIWPNGIYYVHQSGEFDAGCSQYRIEHKRNGSSVWSDLGTFNYIGASYSPLRRIFRADVSTRDVYDIRITRLMQSDSPPRYQAGFRVDYIDNVTCRALRYPNTSLVGLRLFATKQLSGGAPDVSVMVRGRKVDQPVFWKYDATTGYPVLQIADGVFSVRSAAPSLAHTTEIDSVADLQNMANDLDGHYYLSQDIDCTGYDFQPVGSTATPFTGTLDGNGFKITNLTINKPEGSEVGLFGCIKGTLTDTGLEDSYITGDSAYRSVSDTGWSCQTFTPAENYDITKVSLKCYRYGSPGNITVSIKATDVDGKPTGADLCSCTIDGNTISTTASFVPFVFSSTASLVSGTKYAICVHGSASLAYLRWRYDSTASSYSGGSFGYSSDSGSTWTLNTSRDFMFNTYKEGDEIVGGIIEDVTLEDCSVLGRSYVGSLVGKIDGYNSTAAPIIHDCHSSGTVTCNKVDGEAHTYFGGMVGYAISGTPTTTYVYIQDCTTSVEVDLEDVVSYPSYIGGFIGGSDNNVIFTNSRVTGDVVSYQIKTDEEYDYYDSENPYGSFSVNLADRVGGFVGSSSSSSFADCAAGGSVSGGTSTGGFVGKNYNCIFTRCSARGSVEGFAMSGGIPI